MFTRYAITANSRKRLIIVIYFILATHIGNPFAVRAESLPLDDMLENLIIPPPYEPTEGIASYYASHFAGKRTASGQRYDPDKLTAAHYSLPLGTVVCVVNPKTQKEVHVTITDRCAKKAFHFIDLSRAAAKKIGLWGKGIMKVIIMPLQDNTPQTPAKHK